MARSSRPLSPHLQVYRPQITSILSITHRMTGVALAAGSLLFTFWITSAVYGGEMFDMAQGILGSFLGQVILWGLCFALYYHMGNGVRHLFWDAGSGFELDQVKTSGMIVIAFAVVMACLTLFLAYQ